MSPRRNYRALAEITAISYSKYWVLSSTEGQTLTATVSDAVSQQTRVLWADSKPTAGQLQPSSCLCFQVLRMDDTPDSSKCMNLKCCCQAVSPAQKPKLLSHAEYHPSPSHAERFPLISAFSAFQINEINGYLCR